MTRVKVHLSAACFFFQIASIYGHCETRHFAMMRIDLSHIHV